MKKFFAVITGIFVSLPGWADCKPQIGKTEKQTDCGPKFDYIICEVAGQSQDSDPNFCDKYKPQHATAAQCVTAGRDRYKICTAKECNSAEGYTESGGRCVCDKKQGYELRNRRCVQVSAPQQSGEPVHVCGMTVWQEQKGDAFVDYIVEGEGATITGPSNCTHSEDGKFECGMVTANQITFTKECFETKTINTREFEGKNCPRVVLHKTCTNGPTTHQEIIEDAEYPEKIKERIKEMCRKSLGTPGDTGECECPTELSLEPTTVKDLDGTDINICKCKQGYKRENGNYTDKCVDAGDITWTGGDINTQQMSQNAEEAYLDEYKREQSLGNKLFTMGSTLMTGEGAMMAAQAYSEQRADEEAERDMAAYLETFKCEYGSGKTFKSSEEEITLPGGNELSEYYTDYKNTANKLKERKAALGLRPGIEAEVLYERAQTGLYQYATAGITGGAYTSLSRALTEPKGKDATEWNKQKEDTKRKLNTGGLLALGGLVVGIGGNYLVNGNHHREELETIFNPLVQQGELQYHDQNFTATEMPINGTRITEVQDDVIDPNPTIGNFTVTGEFESTNLFNSGEYTIASGSTTLQEIVSTIVEPAKEGLSSPNQQDTKFRITVTGFTDRQQVRKDSKRAFQNNKELSKLRANEVANYLNEQIGYPDRIEYIFEGAGEDYCNDAAGKKLTGPQPSCRKIVIKVEDITPYRAYIE